MEQAKLTRIEVEADEYNGGELCGECPFFDEVWDHCAALDEKVEYDLEKATHGHPDCPFNNGGVVLVQRVAGTSDE